MLTYRTGIAGSPGAAEAMTAHLLELTIPAEHAMLAAYYAQSVAPAPGDGTAVTTTIAQPRRDLDPAIAALLGIDAMRAPTAAEISHLLAGTRTDGTRIPGKQQQEGSLSLAAELGLDPDDIATAAMVDRVLTGHRADTGEALTAARKAALHKRFLALYGVTDGHPDVVAIDQMRAGQRGDGTPLHRSAYRDALSVSRTPVAFVDLTFSADKSLSIAYGLAPTEAERALLLAAHQGAVADTMRQVEKEIGRARKGKAGRAGFDQGRIAWVEMPHMTARPTVDVARNDGLTGETYTQTLSVPQQCNPQVHSHVLVPNCVLVVDEATGATRVGGLDLGRLQGRVHELGALYQAFVAHRLRRLGVQVELDDKTGAARLTAVPALLRDLFSDRTLQGTAAAREYARTQGLEWDHIDPEFRIRLLKSGVQNPRGAKRDGMSDFEFWRAKARTTGWQPNSVLALDSPVPVPALAARIEVARQAALPFLDEALRRSAVLDESAVRIAAVRGLIASGVESAAEIAALVERITADDVLQDGVPTRLIGTRVPGAYGAETVRYTTDRHVDRETRLVELARLAALDRSQALSIEEVHAAAAESDFAFSGTHGEAQMAVMLALGTGGRLTAAIGAAGAGKTTLLGPLVSAWQKRGRAVFGVAVAWRQAQALGDAGVFPDRCLALAALIARVRAGTLVLSSRDVVVVDEISLISNRDFLTLLELQETSGLSIVAVGDPLQGESI